MADARNAVDFIDSAEFLRILLDNLTPAEIETAGKALRRRLTSRSLGGTGVTFKGAWWKRSPNLKYLSNMTESVKAGKAAVLRAAFQPIAKKLLETALPENVYKTLIIDSKDLAMKTQEEADAFLSALRDCGLSQHEIAVFALIASIGTGYENLQRMIGLRQDAKGKPELFFREAILPAESDGEEGTPVSPPLMNSLINRIDATDEPVPDPAAADETQPLACLIPDIAFEEDREYLQGIAGSPEEKRSTLEILGWALHFINDKDLRRIGDDLRKTISEANKVPLETIVSHP